MNLIVKGGRVIDPKNDIDDILDIVVENHKIVRLGKDIKADGMKVIDATGKLVVPGLIDIHVHFREPGFEYKEDLNSGLRSAVSGGFTGVCPMPNTKPVIQTQADVEFVMQKTKSLNLANIYPLAAVTRDQKGKELTEFGELKKGGVVGLSDDGHPIEDSNMMRRALEYAKKFDFVLMAHCEDRGLFGCGCMNEGVVSTKLGLHGIPSESESVEVARDIQLADLTGSKLHFCHMSSKKSLDLIRQAKKNGSHVTAETAPHYFTLTEDAVLNYNTRAKMNPPLRTAEDRNAVIEALRDGVIDVIATDHAPHSDSEKELEFERAPFGIIGLETALPLCLNLVREGVLSMRQLIEKMSLNPAGIINVDRGHLSEGAVADITIFDPDLEWVFEKKSIVSKSSNSPYLDQRMRGKATDVIVDGRIVMRNGKIRASGTLMS